MSTPNLRFPALSYRFSKSELLILTLENEEIIIIIGIPVLASKSINAFLLDSLGVPPLFEDRDHLMECHSLGIESVVVIGNGSQTACLLPLEACQVHDE